MADLPDLFESLRSVKHFRNLNPADLNTILTSGQIHRFPTGATIVADGEPCSGMFVLLQGRVHLCKTGPDGQVNIMSVIEPVIMFNEVAALDGGTNPITAIAVDKCLVWKISYESFQELLKRYPTVGLSLLRVLARRNRQMIAHYEDLSFRPVLARTAKLLLDLSDYGHQPIQRRGCSIEEMSSRIATVPEAISRSLNILKTQGAISVSRVEIAVLSVEKLATLAQVGSRSVDV
jgi:CRP-like cAMP-binding protein